MIRPGQPGRRLASDLRIAAGVTNCSSHCRPCHFPEKLIPPISLNALEGKPLSVNGDGRQARDWSFADGDLRVLVVVLDKGRVGESVILGGRAPKHHIDVVAHICDIFDTLRPGGALEGRSKAASRRRSVGTSRPSAAIDPGATGFPSQGTAVAGAAKRETTLKLVRNNSR
ncbi:MAG: hypothetical protein C0511_14380 [Hyphomicrobium sp.]|nr:hypothetical protein [Hyphomicrobium sp.]PPC80398.1 MAG: hypothetical protein CTY40_09285 [Hyphomicrobium sp.]